MSIAAKLFLEENSIFTTYLDSTSGGTVIQVHNNDIVILNGGISIDATSGSYIGIGTTSARATVDFSMVGGIGTTGYMITPVISTAAQVGLTTVFGGVVYNSTTNKLQCYTPTGWQDLF